MIGTWNSGVDVKEELFDLETTMLAVCCWFSDFGAATDPLYSSHPFLFSLPFFFFLRGWAKADKDQDGAVGLGTGGVSLFLGHIVCCKRSGTELKW